MESKQKLIDICECRCEGKLSGYYYIYQIENNRSINPKTKRNAKEIIAVGVPIKHDLAFRNRNKQEIEQMIDGYKDK